MDLQGDLELEVEQAKPYSWFSRKDMCIKVCFASNSAEIPVLSGDTHRNYMKNREKGPVVKKQSYESQMICI